MCTLLSLSLCIRACFNDLLNAFYSPLNENKRSLSNAFDFIINIISQCYSLNHYNTPGAPIEIVRVLRMSSLSSKRANLQRTCVLQKVYEYQFANEGEQGVTEVKMKREQGAIGDVAIVTLRRLLFRRSKITLVRVRYS